MYRTTQLIVWISLLLVSGCYNRPGGPFGTSARVPAPGTYQLRIPSLANNQPYYTPNPNSQTASSVNAANNPNGAIVPPVNPNGAAPTTVASRDLQGWKLTNGPAMAAAQAPVYQSPNGFNNSDPFARSNLQVASGSTLTTGSGPTAGTMVAAQPIPSRDSTRMAAIDASSIRPPAMSTTPPQPQQYFGNLHGSGVALPPTSASATNANGFTQPQLPNRYATQPVVGTPGSYQSPFVRGANLNGGVMPSAGSTGWVAREGSN